MAIDFNASLDKLLNTYTKVSEVRAATSVAKYNTAAQMQQSTFNAPVGYTASEAYAVGNANPLGVGNAVPVGASASMSIPKELIYGGLGLAALALAWKVLK
ncbi:MAG TPA: hypothetical protein DIW64_16165 [Cellvibrio sp.]|nr:hypothetical protein [Cellvibrio sp.]